jgi:hypothetical protein
MNNHNLPIARKLVLQMRDKLTEQENAVQILKGQLEELEKLLTDQGPTCKPKGLKQKLCEILECYKCPDPL